VDHGAAGIEDGGGLAEMVRNAARVQVRRRDTSPITAPLRKARLSATARLIAIGSSTGGVEALQTLLGSFPRIARPP
jgi:two-component system chemotaxis response regulator CheB